MHRLLHDAHCRIVISVIHIPTVTPEYLLFKVLSRPPLDAAVQILRSAQKQVAVDDGDAGFAVAWNGDGILKEHDVLDVMEFQLAVVYIQGPCMDDQLVDVAEDDLLQVDEIEQHFPLDDDGARAFLDPEVDQVFVDFQSVVGEVRLLFITRAGDFEMCLLAIFPMYELTLNSATHHHDNDSHQRKSFRSHLHSVA